MLFYVGKILSINRWTLINFDIYFLSNCCSLGHDIFTESRAECRPLIFERTQFLKKADLFSSCISLFGYKMGENEEGKEKRNEESFTDVQKIYLLSCERIFLPLHNIIYFTFANFDLFLLPVYFLVFSFEFFIIFLQTMLKITVLCHRNSKSCKVWFASWINLMNALGGWGKLRHK